MKIVSLNIGQIKHYNWRNGTDSAILKSPVFKTIALSDIGLEGDEQANIKNHGGPEKAVLIIPEMNYALFEVKQPFGYLGDNITLSDIDESKVALGDKFQIGDVILEVSQPRSPCWKLNALSEDNSFLKRYAESGRVGFYCRVLQKGSLKVNDKVVYISCLDKFPVMIQPLFLAKYHHQSNKQVTLLQQALKHPALSKSWKNSIQMMLSNIKF